MRLFNKCKTFWKIIAWRTIAMSCTFIIAYAIDGSYKRAGAIAAIDASSKFILHYSFEKCWKRIEKKCADNVEET